MSREQTLTYFTVVEAGLPPTDMETVYVGNNGIGYCGCFNHVAPDGACWYCTAEENTLVMSPLHEWARLSA